MNTILSVIVPVYNGQQYLIECLDSLTRQGFDSNYEVIVVNDGSCDKSDEIVQKYCIKYDYFHLISICNGGVSNARNIGIKYSAGQYIAFVDADDVVSDECYREILQQIVEMYIATLSSRFCGPKCPRCVQSSR